MHQQLLSGAVLDARAFDELVGGDPTVYVMRGNTAAGKTRATANIPALSEAMALSGDIPHRAINPDDFKVDLVAEDSDLALTSSQVHQESSILAERMEEDVMAAQRADGQPISVLVDKRFGDLESIEALAKEAASSGRDFVMYDVDAPLESSLVGVLMRDPNDPTAGPRPDFDGGQVEADIDELKTTVVDEGFIDSFVADLDADFASSVRATLEPYIGMTWNDALVEHSAKKPELGG